MTKITLQIAYVTHRYFTFADCIIANIPSTFKYSSTLTPGTTMRGYELFVPCSLNQDKTDLSEYTQKRLLEYPTEMIKIPNLVNDGILCSKFFAKRDIEEIKKEYHESLMPNSEVEIFEIEVKLDGCLDDTTNATQAHGEL